MSESNTSLERQTLGTDAPYEAPTVTPVGNLNDLLLGATGTACDAGDHSNPPAQDDGSC